MSIIKKISTGLTSVTNKTKEAISSLGNNYENQSITKSGNYEDIDTLNIEDFSNIEELEIMNNNAMDGLTQEELERFIKEKKELLEENITKSEEYAESYKQKYEDLGLITAELSDIINAKEGANTLNDSEIVEAIMNFKEGTYNEEAIKKYGWTQEDINKSYDELMNIAKNQGNIVTNNANIEQQIEAVLNKYEITRGLTYEEFEKLKDETEQNYLLTEANARAKRNELKMLEFDSLIYSKDFQENEDKYTTKIENAEGDIEILNKLSDTGVDKYLKIYNYLKENNPEKIDAYIDSLQDIFNQYKGGEKAKKRIAELDVKVNENGELELDGVENYLQAAGYGLADGVYDFGEGFVKIFKKGEITVQDYECMAYMQYLAEYGDYHSEVYSVGQGAGNMAPTVLASIIIGMVAPETAVTIPVIAKETTVSAVAASLATTSMIGLSSYGTTKNQMLHEGYTMDKARLYAAISATTDAVSETLFSGIEGIGVNAAFKSTEKETFRRMALKFLKSSLQEGGEEVIQNTISKGMVDRLVLGETVDIKELTEENVKTFIQSALVASILNGGSAPINIVANNTSYQLEQADLMNIMHEVATNPSSVKALTETLETKTTGVNIEEINKSLTRAQYSNLDNSVQQEITRHNHQEFNLEEFMNKDIGDGGILLITDNQSVMTDNYTTKHEKEGGEHGWTVEAIYKAIYGSDYKLPEGIWQENIMKKGDICVQLCDNVDSIVWIPDELSQRQFEMLESFNKKIKEIYKNNPKYFNEHPMEFSSSLDIETKNNLDAILEEARKRVTKEESFQSETIVGDTIVETANNIELDKKIQRYKELLSIIKSDGFKKYLSDFMFDKTVTDYDNYKKYEGISSEFHQLQSELSKTTGISNKVDTSFSIDNYFNEIFIDEYLKDKTIPIPDGISPELVEYLEKYSQNPDITAPMGIPPEIIDYIQNHANITPSFFTTGGDLSTSTNSEESTITPLSEQEIESFIDEYLKNPFITVPEGISNDLVEYLEKYSQNPDITAPMGIPPEIIKYIQSHKNPTPSFFTTGGKLSSSTNEQNDPISPFFNMLDGLTLEDAMKVLNESLETIHKNEDIEDTNENTISETNDKVNIIQSKTTKFIDFSATHLSEVLAKLTEHFGDFDYWETQDRLKKGETVQEVLSKLSGQQKLEFEKFINDTIEGKFLSSLTTEEMQCLAIYTSGHFNSINEYSRNNKTNGIIEGYTKEEIVKNIDSALSKYKSFAEPIKLYRGVDIEAFSAQKDYKDIFNGIDPFDLDAVYYVLKQLEGLPFYDDAYMSTSPAYDCSFAKYQEFPIVLEIFDETGTHGAYINEISIYHNLENEYLLKRGTNLQMIEVLPPAIDKNGNKKIVIKCQVVDNNITPNFTTIQEVIDYADNLSIDESINIDVMELKISKLLKDKYVTKNGTDSLGIYYDLLNLTQLDPDIKIPLIENLIQNNKFIREAIYKEALEEMQSKMSSLFNISEEQTQELLDCILGEDFIDKGYTDDMSLGWSDFESEIEELCEEKVKELIMEKEPVLWSGIDDEFHPLMNDKYTTIENSTLGENLYMLDIVFPNWDSKIIDTKVPCLENFWGILSTVYAKACSEIEGKTSIKFLYPTDITNPEKIFGNLFKSVEFPIILEESDIKTIEITSVEQDSMTEKSTISIDISDISEYYNKKVNQIDDIDVLEEEVYNMLLNKVKSSIEK